MSRFNYYSSSISQALAIRTLQYSVPEKVAQYVQMIQPTTRFGQFKQQGSHIFRAEGSKLSQAELKKQATSLVSCGSSVTPACLKDLYKFGNYTTTPGNGNKLGIAGFLNEYAKFADMAQFLQQFAPKQDPVKNNFTYALINGGFGNQTHTSTDDVEANCKRGLRDDTT